MDRLNKLAQYIAAFPTTQFRILLSSVAYLATVVAVLWFDKQPDLEFYGFLLVWAGIDVGQFLSKRATYQPDAALYSLPAAPHTSAYE